MSIEAPRPATRPAPVRLPAAPGRAPVAEPPPRTAPDSSRAAFLFVALAAFWTVLLVASRPFDNNAWWHLTNGRLILHDGSLPAGDPFSWAAAGKSAVLDGWLYDMGAAGLRNAFGPAAISVVALAGVVVLGFAVFGRARGLGSRAWPAAMGAVIALVLVKGFVAERPQVLSYLFFLGLLVLADRAFAGSNRAWVGLVALVAVWANVHLAFTLGIGLVGVLAVATVIRTRAWTRPVLIVGTIFAAGLVNPYGVRVYLLPFEARGVSRIIDEWRPWGVGHLYDLLLLAVVVAAIGCLAITGRWRNCSVVLPLLLLVALSADAIRNAPFLVLVVAPEIALGLSTVSTRLSEKMATEDPRWRVRGRAARHGAILAAFLLVLSAAGHVDALRERGAPAYPVEATAAIPSGCRLLNEDMVGGYVADTRADVLVSQDGRQVEGISSLVTQQRVLDARHGWRTWLDRHGVDCVMARTDRAIVDTLTADGWDLRASDPNGVLLVRPGA